MEFHRSDASMIKHPINHFLFLIAFILIVCFPACLASGKNTTITPTPYLIQSPNIIITPNSVPSPMPTSSPAPSDTPIPTPLPTLSQEDAKQKIDNLMKTNGGCQLPCLWGITPGKSLLPETKYQFEQFMKLMAAKLEGINGGAEFSYPDKGPFEGAFGSVYLRSKNNFVVAMSLEGYHTIAQNYAIQDVLQRYGLPDNIWIYTLRDSYGEGVLPFVITLDYSSHGFLVYYKGNGQPIYKSGSIRLCYPQNSIFPKILVWDQKDENPFAKNKSDYVYRIWYEMKPIEEAMNMSEDEFYKLFTEPNQGQTICLNIPASLWKY